MRGAIALAWLGGCSTEYALMGVDPDGVLPAGQPALADHAPGMPTDGPPAYDGAMPEVEEAPPPEPARERVVELGVADYLFVVDSSASMASILNHVLAGFDAVRDANAFTRGARIGVMSTLPGDPLRPTAIHPRAKQKWWLQFEPGFQSLVDADAITIYRELAPPQVAERFPMDGCQGWFAPSDVNPKGVSCLVANTQLSLYPVLVEAGLLALQQRLTQPEPLFRSGAAANVIFVSDTHDPGLTPEEPGFAELVAARPTFEQLRLLAASRQTLSSFRVHAIAPADLCSDEDWTGGGDAYFEAALAANGEILDVCTATPADYVAFVQRMAEQGAVPQAPVIALADGEQVLDVLVDDQPAPFALSLDGRALTLPFANLAGSQRAASQVRLVLR
jgi:hypothetical protein